MDHLLPILLSKNSIYGIDKKDLHFQLLTHPHYPSLVAITDTLDYFEINNVAVNVPKEALDELPEVFLTLIKEDIGDELVLVIRKAQQVKLIYASEKKTTISKTEFLKKWSATVVAVEKGEDSNSLSVSSRSIADYAVWGLMAVLVGLNIFTPVDGWFPWVYKCLSISGLLLSYFIVKEQLGIKNSFSAKVCGVISSNPEGCATVINSKESKVFKDLGLSDFSLIYFVSLCLGISLMGLDSSFLLSLSIASFSVVAYSYYLQIRLKSWCALCLGLSGVLVAQFIASYFYHEYWSFNVQYASNAVLLVLIVGALWVVIKKMIIKNQELNQTRNDFYKFKRNPDFFLYALEKSRKHELIPLDISDQIIFGNVEGKLQLIAVTNPLCGFCSDPFKVYYQLLSQYPKDIGIQFVFSTPPDVENISTKILLTVIEIYQTDRKAALEALNYWFTNKDTDQWFKKFESSEMNLDSYQHKLAKHRDWCNANDVNYTPETIINGCHFPRKQYQYTDLPLFIEDLKEIGIPTELELVLE